MLPCLVFFYRILNISNIHPSCPLYIYIKINNNSWNCLIYHLYTTIANFLNLGVLMGLSLINYYYNFYSLNIYSNNYYYLSTINLVYSLSKNNYPTWLLDRLSTIDSQSIASAYYPYLSTFPSTIINSINNSFLASSINLWTMEWT
jgi:hypothetical protein